MFTLKAACEHCKEWSFITANIPSERVDGLDRHAHLAGRKLNGTKLAKLDALLLELLSLLRRGRHRLVAPILSVQQIHTQCFDELTRVMVAPRRHAPCVSLFASRFRFSSSFSTEIFKVAVSPANEISHLSPCSSETLRYTTPSSKFAWQVGRWLAGKHDLRSTGRACIVRWVAKKVACRFFQRNWATASSGPPSTRWKV